MSTGKRSKGVRGVLTLALIVGVLIAVGMGMASAARGRTARVRQALSPTTKAPKAHGKMLLVVRAGKKQLDGAFDVGARHLAAKGKFEVLIGGVKVGELSSNRAGNGRIRLRTRPRGRALLLGVDPRGKQVVLRDEDGDDVLEGDCPDDKPNAGKIACCVPDSAGGAFSDGEHHSGTHFDHGDGDHGDDDDGDDSSCRRLTADDCAAVSGSSAGGSCLPDPCTTAPPPGAVCCVPEHDDEDGEGAECKPLTPDRCASKGGTMISATACDPNPCNPTPPAEPRIACCTPDDGEMECHHRTAAECAAHQGVNKGAVSCDANPCGSGGDGGHD
jgi:hypothetical protein